MCVYVVVYLSWAILLVLCVYFPVLCCRLISEKTVEENILKKANQKRMLGDVAIEGGNFTTAFFKQVCVFPAGFLSSSVYFLLLVHLCFLPPPVCTTPAFSLHGLLCH